MVKASADDLGIADLIAFRRSASMACTICDQSRCAILLARSQRGSDHFERLYCVRAGRGFSRVWIGGYA